MSTKAYAVASGTVLACLLYMWQKQRLRDSNPPLPPSLKGEWLIGNLRSLPAGDEHLYFAKLSQELDRQTTVVLNSPAAVNDLLDKRAAVYSDRPGIVMLTDEWL
ncbi:hypothetical protein FRC09_007273 [Ceratobasidium sp. 395]|nr:hypothetical protein FRC09_007273 [Ceratobasidium sp. 395]